MAELAYVGLGSNLGDREATIRTAAGLIGARRLSRIVEPEPWGNEQQPKVLNAVAELETGLVLSDEEETFRLLSELFDEAA